MSKILIVEDEEAIADLEKDYLELSDFEVTIENTGDKGLETALSGDFDLVILDLMLPGIDGFEVCKRIREEKNIPIIMVSAKKDDIDKIRGLGLGADDYMTKPFSIRELTARIKANLRKHVVQEEEAEADASSIKIKDLILDAEKYVVVKNGVIIDLTMKEFEVLKLLAIHAGQVFTREQILKNVWGYDYYGDLRSVDVTIRRIREKIEDNTAEPKYIITKRGIGYYV